MNDDQVTCDVCQGLGLVTKDVPVGHADFGKAFPCPACTIHDKRIQGMLSKISRLDSHDDKTFDMFKLQPDDYSNQAVSSLEGALNVAMQYAAAPRGWLVIQGACGTGKTHLAAAIGHQAISQNIRTIFVTAPDLLDHLRNTYAPDAEITYDQKFEQMSQVDLLILDDLGAENQTPWAREKLYQLLNHRHHAKLATVITTNLEKLEFPERIRSRMYDANLTITSVINAPDFRQKDNNDGVTDPEIAPFTNMASYQTLRFENFDADHPQTLKLNYVLDAAISYAENPQGWFLIIGEPGTGKTHLAASIANSILYNSQDNKDIAFVSQYDLIDYLRGSFSRDNVQDPNARLQSLRRVPYLFLDDFKISGKTPEWVKDKLFQILDYRYKRQDPTIIVAMDGISGFGEMEQFAPQIFSRLSDRSRCFWVDMGHYDYRRQER